MSFIYIFDLMGTLVFAMSGALLGLKKDMDVYGLFVLAVAVAVGGGTIRDIMLGRTPPFILRDPNYLIVTFIAVVIVLIFTQFVVERMKYLISFDAIGLGVFTVIGVTKGLEAGLSWYAALFTGVLTCTGGGMLRDILAGDVPFVLKREVYASASIAGGMVFLILHNIGVMESINAFVTALTVTLIRLISVRNNFNLPRFGI